MAFKTIVAAGMMALSMAFVPATAQAETNVTIGIGTGWVGPGYGDRCWSRRHCNYYYGGHGYYGHPYYNGPRPRYYDDVPVRPRRVSCGLARDIVADHGFRRVVARDCNGRVYSFRARKNGWSYIVSVSSRNGRIVDVQRI